MAFAQCTYRESQGHRDLSESCGRKVHHMGIRGKISRDTLTPENFIWAILSKFNSIRRGERCQFPSFFSSAASDGQLQDVQPALEPVDGVDNSVLIDVHVIN